MKQSIFSILLIITFNMFSQGFQSAYIEKMDNTINMRLSLDNDLEAFDYSDKDISYTIQPNTNVRMNLHTNYRFISFKIGYSPRIFSDHDEENKGKSKVFKLQTDLYYQNWMQSLEYVKITGHYATNIKGADDLEYIILPYLKTATFRSTTRYKFNENYSIKALLTHTEIQKKSAGSIISSLKLYKTDITNKEGAQDLYLKGFIINTGYFYTLVIDNKWYSNFGISPGLGIEFNKIHTRIDGETYTDNETAFTADLNTQLGFGYNSPRFYTGLDFRLTATGRSKKSIADFNTVRGIVHIFIGYRFDSPRLIKDSVDWLDERNPLK